jgi:hypothetical protein
MPPYAVARVGSLGADYSASADIEASFMVVYAAWRKRFGVAACVIARPAGSRWE